MHEQRSVAASDPGSSRTTAGRATDVSLYVFAGSHACRSAMLMLEHKRIPYRRVDLPVGLHPLGVRLRGFPGNPIPIRSVDGATHRSLAVLDRLGTVPALRFGAEKVQTNRRIARFLERARPEPPLFPEDPTRRVAVEEAERWGDETLQMSARRIVLAASPRGLDALEGRGGHGRLGPLLSSNERVRMLASRMAGRSFRATPYAERSLLEALPGMLDRVDAWIAAGVLDGEQLNAADLMIAPSLALLAYRRDLRGDIDARPAGSLLERVLPEPKARPAPS
jgi:glutathione S-transferase